jgi:hypothetical protein
MREGWEPDVAIFQPRFTPVIQGPRGIMELFTLKLNRRQQDLKNPSFHTEGKNPMLQYLLLVTQLGAYWRIRGML